MRAYFIEGGRIFPHRIGERGVDARQRLLSQIIVFGVRGFYRLALRLLGDSIFLNL